MTTSFLSDQTKELILGSILGDGSLRIHKPYKNARFSFRHTVRNEDYFFWKVNQLKEISSEQNWWRQEKNGLGGQMFRYQSAARRELTDLYCLTHERDKIAIRRRWLNMLTPLSLAVWWLDDGSLIGNGRKGVLCTDPFSYEDQKLLARYLLIAWKIKVSIGKITRTRDGVVREYYRLWFRSSEELKKFLTIILPFVKATSMLPKVMLLYKDSELQQRWISEVVRLTGFSEIAVKNCVSGKKEKWKAFRK
jgi:hypothetical protein